MVDRALTSLEALALAVRSEIESTHLYDALASRAENPEARRLLRELAADEESHRAALMKRYRRLLGDQEPSIPLDDGRDKRVSLGADADYEAVIRGAHAKEVVSELFYKKAALEVNEFKTRAFFLDLAETERQHAVALGRMLKQLMKDPHWLDRKEQAVHEGP